MERSREDRGGQQQREPNVHQGEYRDVVSFGGYFWGGTNLVPAHIFSLRQATGQLARIRSPLLPFIPWCSPGARMYLQKFKLLYNFEAVQACRLEIVDVDKTNKPDTVDFRKCVST